jgi:hypothetical protein
MRSLLNALLTVSFILLQRSETTLAFAPPRSNSNIQQQQQHQQQYSYASLSRYSRTSTSQLQSADLNVVGLVAGQENYGLAIVCLGEALWSFSQAPSLSHAKVLVPASIAAVILVAVSGPMITNSADAASVSNGLFIATAVSVGLGASYVWRLVTPQSPSSKEIVALGLLLAIAGFFSFSQNLVVDGFVTLPSISLPSLPMPTGDGYVDPFDM